MKLEESLRNSNILEPDNEIKIEEAIVKTISKKLDVSIVLSYAVSKDKYDALYNLTKRELSNFNYEVRITIGYQDDSLESEEYKPYLESILKALSSVSARFKMLNAIEAIIKDNTICFLVAYDAMGLDDLCNPIKLEFEKYGLSVNVKLELDQNQSVNAQIKELDEKIYKQLEQQKKETEAANKLNEKMRNEVKAGRWKKNPDLVTEIKNIPATLTGINQYEHEQGYPIFLIEGYVFDIEIRSFAKTKSNLAVIKFTDETDSIVVKKWLRSDAEKQLFESDIKKNTMLKITGEAQYDNFAKDVVIIASNIEVLGTHKEEEVIDDAPVKRVELHAHTKMTTLDGLADAADYVKLCHKWGWKSMAFTDLAGVYAIPDVAHAIPKGSDFKPIYGVELAYVDDSDFFITFDKKDINLHTATYVVYDIETTGFSQEFDRIIEIAAHKVKNGRIIEEFECFVNPQMPISKRITEITSITDEMVKDAETIDLVLPKFMEFAKDSILVAHNARFDVGFIYANIKRLNLNYEMLPAIDTLNLFRAGYHDKVKAFNLEQLCKYFKIKQEHHHRASDDTRVTALCFIEMLNDLYNKGINNYQDINNIIDPQIHWKHIIPKHINVLAKNNLGYKNMYKLVSDALTNHFYKEAKALKSEIEKYREGILLGSGSGSGEVFENALNRSQEDLEKSMAYYDYIEIMPPTCYNHLAESLPNGLEDIKKVIIKICDTAKKLGKIVVATSNSHYIRPNYKKYRDILINSPQIGGGIHPLKRKKAPDAHLRTTSEMLEEMKFLGEELAYLVVVTNTNIIADSIERYQEFKPDMFAPRDDEFKDSILHVDSIVDEVNRIVKENTYKFYGDNPHPIVKARLERELNSIISNGYASVYYMSHLMVVKSLNDGYLVGSRGSVGSSLVATMMDITEINPLAPHYRCKKCKFHSFRMRADEKELYGISEVEKPLQPLLEAVETGYDLPDAKCPVCGAPLAKDGHDIPFETFLGFDGDKVPDIDLNFSGEYQAKAHEYIREVFGPENAFRGGTVGTIAEKNAFGYVKGYCERTGITLRNCEMERIANYLVGIKRSTGQHPGGIVVVPHYVDIYDVTPVQYPADNTENAWRTTHYDYHSFENNLLKLDVLGHDDPTIIKYLMDYVHAHQEEFPFTTPQDIPIDDKNIYRLFNCTEVIGLTEAQLKSKVASFAVPEFGTQFVRGMLVETLPTTFAQLVKISGLSHGTDVWSTNAQDLVGGKTPFGVIPFKEVIGCRDDIMVYLLHAGLEPLTAFQIMEFVRKGKVAKDPEKWAKYRQKMTEKNVPEWYIWSCERIKYMFPKAHATAYVLMALRIAWFKVNYPPLFYSAWFSKRAKAFDAKAFLGGSVAIMAKIEDTKAKPNQTAKDDDIITALYVAYEMCQRGIKFLPVDINKSSATIFLVEDGNLRLPFVAVDGLGESVAYDIVSKREESPFKSKKDVQNRTRLNKSLYEEFEIMHAFGDLADDEYGNLPNSKNTTEEGLFAFLNED